MDSLLQDVRFSLRLLAKDPGLTVVVVLTLAVTLGANTAVFSVMNGVLLRALPYPEPGRIMDVALLVPPGEGRPSRKEYLTGPQLRAWQQSARTLSQLAAYRAGGLTLNAPGGAEHVTGAEVSAELFPLLRVDAAQGHAFHAGEQQPGRERVVLLSRGLWHRRFEGNPHVVGSIVALDGVPHTIVGVMPEGFSFPAVEVQLWTPLALDPPANPGSGQVKVENYAAVARLREGVSREQAEAEGEAILRGTPESGGEVSEGAAAPGGSLSGKVRLSPLREEMVAEVRPALLAMFCAVGLVVLIACINLANLLLARSSARQREMAIRSALGGSRRRLFRQALTESTLLSLAGGLSGLLVAGLVQRVLPGLLPRDIPRLTEIYFDARVFLFALAAAGLTGLLFGLVPALRSSSTNLTEPLRGGTAEGAPSLPSQGLFVVAEVAVAFVLLAGAGLLLRSFLHLVSVEPGYEPNHVLTAGIDLDPARYDSPARTQAFFDDLLARVSRHPHVKAAGVVSLAPLASGFTLTSVEVLGRAHARTMAVIQLSSPGYLTAMGLRLARGRWLTLEDQATSSPVAVANETFVRRYLAGGSPLGQRLKVGPIFFEIVGVLRDERLLGLTSDPKPELFTTYHVRGKIPGSDPERLTLAVRTTGAPSALVPFLRACLLELDPTVAAGDLRPMTAKLAASVAQPRFYALLLGVFAGLALLLAAAGVYAVLSYSVARQTRALGVRRAVGATSRAILALVVGRGLALVAVGLAIGMVVALGTTRALAHLLFGVTTRDPLSFVAAAVALLAVTLVACYQPARRATRVDPMDALREEG